MSFSPYRLVTRLAVDPELAALSVLDAALKQAACALLAVHQDIGEVDDDSRATSAARAIIDAAWDLRDRLRHYRAALASDRRDRDVPL